MELERRRLVEKGLSEDEADLVVSYRRCSEKRKSAVLVFSVKLSGILKHPPQVALPSNVVQLSRFRRSR
jgi:hypothetical protein